MPFDIASRRLTPFSLKDGKSKGEIKRYIKGVIQDIVENILENGKRVKTGFSDLRLGCYDDGSISNMLHPIEVSNSVSFVKHKTQILDESLKLVEQIRSMKITEPSELLNTEEASNADEKQTSNATAIIRKDGSVLTPVTSSLKLNLFKLQRVHIKDEDRNTIIDLCKNYLGIDIYEDTDFFNIGNLERKYDLMSSYSYEGTKDEENKYDSIMMLEYNLHRVRMLDWYATTFDGLFFIPLAIENASKVYDEDVDVHVKINKGVVEVIIPSKELINPDMRGLEGLIYEEDVIKELLMMPESSDISYDTDISYTLADRAEMERAIQNILINAIRYSPDGEQVIVTVTETNTIISCSIENTGVKIPETTICHLFEPFYRVDISRNSATGGTGLGLYIVRGILENHNAEYGIKNTENGVCFWLRLPKKQ